MKGNGANITLMFHIGLFGVKTYSAKSAQNLGVIFDKKTFGLIYLPFAVLVFTTSGSCCIFNQSINQNNFFIRNSINMPLGTLVTTEGRPSRKGMFWDGFWRWQRSWRNGQIVEGCFQREGVQELNALAPVIVFILGTNRVIPLFDFSECDGSGN